jgi:glc operon protein GlcG
MFHREPFDARCASIRKHRGEVFMSISVAEAQSLISRAFEAATAQSVAIVAVVVDLGGHAVALARMDGVNFINIDAAQRKATLAAAFAVPTSQIQTMIGKDPIAGPVIAADQRVNMMPGGAPYMRDGKCVGALGIAGGHYMQDHAVAEYATSA